MKFENSPLSESFSYHKLEMPFGDFFLCENFIIAEIHTGVHFDWQKIGMAAKEIIAHYGLDSKVGYISNRVNSYSVDPQDWANISNNSNQLIGTAIVYYNHMTELNAQLEKRFATALNMHTCYSLEEAIDWVNNLKIAL
ncbi:hypothetical protein [Tamlana sp. I1]|uniref:hypothetical protein n=1 Tax=Tamlana sp. I1 TaxID=2762061 RepID=UPI00188DF88B|nr:hypothetical protein [Tamlana sp. I1]